MLGSIWLTTDNKEIEKIILSLSKKENTISFKAHVTLVNGIQSNTDVNLKMFIERFKKIKNILLNKKIVLKPKIIKTGDSFSQSIFITFFENPDILKLRENIIDRLIKPNNYQFNKNFYPHLSLIYKIFSNKEYRQNITKQIKIPSALEFNDLKLILEEKPIEKNEDILKWKIF